MVKINILVTDNEGNKVGEEELTGETMYLILQNKIQKIEGAYAVDATSGYCGSPIPDDHIATSWFKGIACILDNQCKHNKLNVSFQMVALAEMLNNKSHEILDEWAKTDLSTDSIPKSLIDFLTKH